MNSERVAVYTAESRLKKPKVLIREMIRALSASFALAWVFIRRDIKSRYRQSLLGYVWAVFPVFVTSFVFIYLQKIGVTQISASPVPYPVYVVFSTTIWQIFVDAVNAPGAEFAKNSAAFTKLNIPHESIIISGLGQVLFSFAFKLIPLVLIFLFYRVEIQAQSVLLVIPIASALGLGTILGLLLLPLSILYKDIQNILQFLIQNLIFVTPVVFPIPTEGMVGHILKLNPLRYVLDFSRDVVFNGSLADLNLNLVIVATLFGLALFTWFIFHVSIPILLERINA